MPSSATYVTYRVPATNTGSVSLNVSMWRLGTEMFMNVHISIFHINHPGFGGLGCLRTCAGVAARAGGCTVP
jgi:hypothetical protein